MNQRPLVSGALQTAVALASVLMLGAGPLSGQALELVTRWTAPSIGGNTLAVLDGRNRLMVTGLSTGWTSVAVHDLMSGELLRTVGREGRGPGEFMSIRGIATRGDSLAVLDGRNMRITVYDPDFNIAKTIRVPLRVNGELAWGPDGFVFGGWAPGGGRGTPTSLWRIQGDHVPHEVPEVGVDSVGWHFVFSSVGDTLWAYRAMSLGAWRIAPGPVVTELVDRPEYNPQVRRGLPEWIVTLNGARGGGWVDHGRLMTIHTRFLQEHEFPACRTCPPPTSDPRMGSVLLVTDIQTGAIESETQLAALVDGLLSPGVVWSGNLLSARPTMSVWRLSVPR